MDQRIESFLTDVLALAGEDPDADRQGVRAALAASVMDGTGTTGGPPGKSKFKPPALGHDRCDVANVKC
jgi:hypothetical protein